MNWGAFLLLMVVTTAVLLLIQRTEAKRRRLAVVLMLVVAYFAYYWANVRGLNREFAIALIVGVILNLTFWLLIGRYNPVGDSDETIQVIGMDD
jgi:hypothetical protein